MEIGRADLIELFGEEHLVTIERAVLAGLGLGPVAVRVLADVGLPAAPARGLSPEVVPLLRVTPLGSVGRYVSFGYMLENSVTVCVDPRTDAIVGLTDREQIFVNSALDLFVETLYWVNRVGRDQVDATGEEYAQAADELHDRLSSLDPPAMADDAWWASVIHEMQLGMM